MSGAEPIALVSLVDACIGIIKTIVDIGRAVHDAQGLPPILRDVFEQLPIIEELLEAAQERHDEGTIQEQESKSAEPILKQCEQGLTQIRDIFRKACPKDQDNRSKRVWTGVKTVFLGRNSQVQKLLKGVQGNLKLLEQKQIVTIGDKLDELQHITEALADGEDSKYSHSGAGSIIVNEGGTPTNYVQSGQNNRQFNNVGVYHEGPVINNFPPQERPERPPIASTNIPYRRDLNFVDRKQLSDQMHNKLAIAAARVALAGLGGVGKSQLAIEYCYRIRESSPDTWVLWIHASNPARYEQSVREIADLIKLPGRKDPKVNIYSMLRDWLRDERHKAWMIVLDNADDASFLLQEDDSGLSLFQCLPMCDHGRVLITTRDKHTGLQFVDIEDLIPVDSMDEEHAVALLETKLGTPANQADIAELVAALEYMPLAITQAAAYITQGGQSCSVQQFIGELRNIDESKKSILDKDFGDLRRHRDAKNAIMLTWQISFERVRNLRPTAADLLSLMSWCDRSAIPALLLRAHKPREPTNTEPEQDGNDEYNEFDESDHSSSDTSPEEVFEEDILMLSSYSFISTTVDASTFEMHRLVQLATRKWLKVEGQENQWKDQFAHNLSIVFPRGDYENWAVCQALYPQARALIELQLGSRDACLSQALVMFQSGRYAMEIGSYMESETMCQRSVRLFSHYLGDSHPATLASVDNLASTYWIKGRYDDAAQLRLEVLEVRKRVLGEKHPTTLTSMSNLASTYSNQGRYNEAIQQQVKVVELTKRVRGEKHPNTLTSMANLAAMYSRQGRYNEAIQLQVEVLELMKSVRGEKHPDMLTSMANLALMYSDQGRHDDAAQLQAKELELAKRVLGKEHPDTLTSMNNLATTYSCQGRHDDAAQLQSKELELAKRVLGKEHPDTLTSMNNLATTYSCQGRYDDAAQLQAKELELAKRVLGKEHPDTLTSMTNLATTYSCQGRYDDAAQLGMIVLEARKRVLGDDHPATLTSMNNLALTFFDQNKLQIARTIMTRCLPRLRAVLGDTHPNTLSSDHGLQKIEARIEMARSQDE